MVSCCFPFGWLGKSKLGPHLGHAEIHILRYCHTLEKEKTAGWFPSGPLNPVKGESSFVGTLHKTHEEPTGFACFPYLRDPIFSGLPKV